MTTKGTITWDVLHPELLDKEWFISRIRNGGSYRQIAKELHCGTKTVQKAAKYHGITRPFIEVNNPKLKTALDKIPK